MGVGEEILQRVPNGGFQVWIWKCHHLCLHQAGAKQGQRQEDGWNSGKQPHLQMEMFVFHKPSR